MNHPLSGQTAVVTGANSGVGRSATEMLLRAGAEVTMVCRSRERGERALAEMRDAGIAGSGAGEARLTLELADLSRQDDVRGAAERIAAHHPTIDILVNNAGIAQVRPVLSADGYELTFATNHIGHFLLTRLLLDRLEAGRGRIVNVSSRGHRGADLRRASLDDIARGRAWKGPMQAYADSKLANILFTFEAVRRWGGLGITANAVHPGVLATDIWNKTPLVARLLIRPLTWFMDRPEVGGAAVMNLVTGPGGDGVTGSYFNVKREEKPSVQASDRILAHELWERSLEWTGSST
ncbi:MAG: SDR family NAD(P)-dependent oxidoreductase [Gemmatimonadetes bacterium]|nr:SDR family NAD(P)-dependent oxidoreductase [Gemmatimonadota bacterium]MYJ68129.1 SDR family NAD(P)-dependent oxidoreductase [Gemmatimonadota bacterium]